MQKGIRIPPGGWGVKDTDPSSTLIVGVRKELPEDEKDEKGERLKRMEARRGAWVNRRMVKELVLELVGSTSTMAMMDPLKNMMVEEVLAEAVMRSEMSRVMESLESMDGMEARIFKELVEREEKRRKQSRLARRMENGEGGYVVSKEEK